MTLASAVCCEDEDLEEVELMEEDAIMSGLDSLVPPTAKLCKPHRTNLLERSWHRRCPVPKCNRKGIVQGGVVDRCAAHLEEALREAQGLGPSPPLD